MNFQRLQITCALLVCACCTGAGAEPDGRKPNIVLILADDLGYGDLGCYGATKIPTPRCDQLARDGARFTDAHTPAAVCTPTRYGLLTGRYAWRTRLTKGVLVGDSPMLIEDGRPTIASLLKQHGYVTAGVGKWHLGLGSVQPTDFSQPLRPGPLTAGFDEFFGIPASLDMTPYVYVHDDRVEALPTVTAEKSPKPRYFDGVFWRDGPAAPGFRHLDVLPRLTQRAVEFITQQTSEQPFFLYFPLTSPHTPWLPTKEFDQKTSLGDHLSDYGNFVAQTDAVIGQVLDALEQQRLAENTLVIVTSDNGAMWLPEFIERTGHRANGPLRGQKADIYEAGHRVPLLVRWPGQTPAGTTVDQTICLTDIFATLAELLEEPLADDVAEDSFSLLPILRDPAGTQPIRDFTIHHSGNGVFAVRQGPWKAIFHLGSGGFTAPAQETPVPGGPAGQLYHLGDDPQEQANRWQAEPEVVQRLTNLLEQAQASGRTRR